MIACYDLRYSPPTYDYVSFELAAEMERLRVGAPTIRVAVLRGPRHGFRDDKLPPFLIEERLRMLDRVVRPLSMLLPACTEVDVVDRELVDRSSFGWGVARHGTSYMIQAARAGVYPLRSRMSAEYRPNLVTITLREASYHPTRNSRRDEWRAVGEQLRRWGKDVVVVPDAERSTEGFFDFEMAPLASRDVPWRAALYSSASMNLFVNNGPAWMCLFMGAPCMIFKMISPDVQCATEQYLRSAGFLRGSAWPNLRPGQHVSWETDESSAMLREIERYWQ